MLPGHQYGSRWRTHCIAGIVSREFYALIGKAIDVGGLEFFLTIAGQISITQVVRQNVDDVRFVGLGE